MEEPHANGTDVRSGRQRWPMPALMLGFWTLFGLLHASQGYFSFGPSGPGVGWWRQAAFQVLVYYVWMALTPAILWAGRRFTPERVGWPRTLLAHVLIGSTVAVLHIGAYTWLTHLMRIYPNFSLVGMDRFVHFVGMYFHLELFTYFAILGIGSALDYYQKYREKELQSAELRAQLSQAQLEALRLQLQPHFLFNTLNSIVGLIRTNKTGEAIRVTTGLSDLLRHVLEHAGRQEVSLREEVEFLERYLEIQRMRFSDRLEVEFRVDSDTLEASVPSLILQPLVENAIRHGIAAREVGGLLTLSASREAGRLQIDVFNDGPALPPGWRIDNGGGIGLANTKARLDRLYGAEGRLEVRNRGAQGVEARLTIPYHRLSGRRNGHGEEDQDVDRR